MLNSLSCNIIIIICFRFLFLFPIIETKHSNRQTQHIILSFLIDSQSNMLIRLVIYPSYIIILSVDIFVKNDIIKVEI